MTDQDLDYLERVCNEMIEGNGGFFGPHVVKLLIAEIRRLQQSGKGAN